MLNLNLSRQLYDRMTNDIKGIVRELYAEACKEVESLPDSYCSDFENDMRGLMMLFNASCQLFNMSEVVKAAKMAPILIPQVKEIGCKMIKELLDLHNYCILHQNSDNFKKYLIDVCKEVTGKLRSIKCLCSRLIRSSDFINQNYISSVVAIRSIIFFSEKIKEIIIKTINQEKLVECKNLGLANSLGAISIGIKHNHLIDHDCNVTIAGFDVVQYFEKVKGLISDSEITDKYNQFLLVDLEKNYGCSFDHVLDFLAKVSLMTPGKETFVPETEILVSNQKIRMINRVLFTEYTYDCRDESVIVCSLCVSRAKYSSSLPDVNVVNVGASGNSVSQQFL